MQLEFEFVLADGFVLKRTPQQRGRRRAEEHVAIRPPVDTARGTAHGRHATAEVFQKDLERQTGLTVSLTITNNRSRVVSFLIHPDKNAVTVRLHHMFLQNDPDITRALAQWIKHPRSRKNGRIVDRFIQENRHQIRAPRPRELTLVTQGRFFDLAELFDEVNRDHFNGAVSAKITWGLMPHPSRRRRRSIRFGSHSGEDDIIRVHPLLDQDFVPRYFVRYIVFHEMLHAYLSAQDADGSGVRRRVHTGAFKRVEQAYPDYARAVAWQEKSANLRRLLSEGPSPRLGPLAGLIPRRSY